MCAHSNSLGAAPHKAEGERRAPSFADAAFAAANPMFYLGILTQDQEMAGPVVEQVFRRFPVVVV